MGVGGAVGAGPTRRRRDRLDRGAAWPTLYGMPPLLFTAKHALSLPGLVCQAAVSLRGLSRMGRQSGPPGWRGELHQARDPTTAPACGRVARGCEDASACQGRLDYTRGKG